jgi:hypothetical protein
MRAIAPACWLLSAAALTAKLSNVAPRVDVNGAIVNAHSGGLYRFPRDLPGSDPGLFYLYGTSYPMCHQAGHICEQSCGYYNNSFVVYTSPDLASWTLSGSSLLALPDAAMIGRLAGKGGAAIKKLRETLRVDIALDDGALTLRLSGSPSAAVDAAAAHCAGLCARFAAGHDVVFVDPGAVKAIIGKGGAAIKALQEETGARVHCGDTPDELRVEGAPAAVAAARARLTANSKQPAVDATLALAPRGLDRALGRLGGAGLRGRVQAGAGRVAPGGGLAALGYAGQTQLVSSCIAPSDEGHRHSLVLEPEQYLGCQLRQPAPLDHGVDAPFQR